jgi:hypothetical protein
MKPQTIESGYATNADITRMGVSRGFTGKKITGHRKS